MHHFTQCLLVWLCVNNMPINLLPSELVEKKGSYKLAESLKNVAIAGFAIFFAFLLGTTAYILILSAQVKSSDTRQVQLKQTISFLQESEQKMVLIKDRIGKAKTILAESTISTSIDNFGIINSTLPASAILTEAKINEKRTENFYMVSSSRGLVQLMSNLLASNLYSKITLKSFSFTPSSGYLVNLELVD